MGVVISAFKSIQYELLEAAIVKCLRENAEGGGSGLTVVEITDRLRGNFNHLKSRDVNYAIMYSDFIEHDDATGVFKFIPAPDPVGGMSSADINRVNDFGVWRERVMCDGHLCAEEKLARFSRDLEGKSIYSPGEEMRLRTILNYALSEAERATGKIFDIRLHQFNTYPNRDIRVGGLAHRDNIKWYAVKVAETRPPFRGEDLEGIEDTEHIPVEAAYEILNGMYQSTKAIEDRINDLILEQNWVEGNIKGWKWPDGDRLTITCGKCGHTMARDVLCTKRGKIGWGKWLHGGVHNRHSPFGETIWDEVEVSANGSIGITSHTIFGTTTISPIATYAPVFTESDVQWPPRRRSSRLRGSSPHPIEFYSPRGLSPHPIEFSSPRGE